MSAHPDDVQYVLSLAEGDADAVCAFEGRYRSMVRHALSVALRRWRPEVPVEPEDYIQDFVGFLFSDGGRRLRTFQGRSTFASWLYTVALRYFQRALARRAPDRRSSAVLISLPDLDAPNPEFQAIARQSAARLRAVVHTLPAIDQLYIRLFFVEGLNATEVARTLGKRQSAVRMRKMRLLERLRTLLTVEDAQ